MIRIAIATISTIAYLAASFLLPQEIRKGLESGFYTEKPAEIQIVPTIPTETPTPTPTFTFTPTFTPTDTPTPIPPTETPAPSPVQQSVYSGRYIDVNLSAQYVTAFENGVAVMGSYASTGVSGMDTPAGTFHIYSRIPSQTMSGPGYSLPGVTYVQYFVGAYSLHTAYWHNNFGHPMSHGCVNLPEWFAAYLWNFASYGTPVYIHY